MVDYLAITNKFLEKWRAKDEVIGAVLAGGYVLGDPSKHSDLDICIILREDAGYRERGNKIIDGVLIEYFANPIKQIKEYVEHDEKSGRKITAHMFATGKLIFSKSKKVQNLIEDMKKELERPFPKLNSFQIKVKKYGLWDGLDNLKEIQNDKAFHIAYYNLLYQAYEAYFLFKREEVVRPFRLHKYMNNKKYREKYGFELIKDKKFNSLLKNSLEPQSNKKMLESIEKLVNHIIKEMGGLKVDGFKIREKLK